MTPERIALMPNRPARMGEGWPQRRSTLEKI